MKKQVNVSINPEFLEKIEKSGEKKSDVINRALEKELNGFFTEAESDLIHCALALIVESTGENFKEVIRSIRRKLWLNAKNVKAIKSKIKAVAAFGFISVKNVVTFGEFNLNNKADLIIGFLVYKTLSALMLKSCDSGVIFIENDLANA